MAPRLVAAWLVIPAALAVDIFTSETCTVSDSAALSSVCNCPNPVWTSTCFPGFYCTTKGCQPTRPCSETDVVGEIGDTCESGCQCPEDYDVRCCLQGRCQDQALCDDTIPEKRKKDNAPFGLRGKGGMRSLLLAGGCLGCLVVSVCLYCMCSRRSFDKLEDSPSETDWESSQE
eukprot:TRINITY_DN15554_c0_g4_i1.p1 TRINITY_DN15554_c0_g4~~TRINITY_DN15554_c0_g4_i1.p1  ORF type:complete len:174 (-),score=21.95 TRINITY_DN15554_c0_g4_i1:387-908(-)